MCQRDKVRASHTADKKNGLAHRTRLQGEQHFKPPDGQRLIGGQGEQISEIQELHRLGSKVIALKEKKEKSRIIYSSGSVVRDKEKLEV